MVERSINYHEDESKYEFPICSICKFYKYEDVSRKPGPVFISGRETSGHITTVAKFQCELLEEFRLFKKNHPDSDSLTYNLNELECYCELMRGISPVECGNKRVSEGIDDHYKINTISIYHKKRGYVHKIEETSDNKNGDRTVDRWEPTQPVFISAQTGQGKNYFIEIKLLPYVKTLNKAKTTKHKVLIISNRIALQKQIDDRIDGDDEDVIYPYAEFADTITYQGLLNRLNHFEKRQDSETSSYLFVICDEAHFFTSDAMFNPDTGKILSAIVNTFKNAIRIYMSATPYECFYHIKSYEHKVKGTQRFVFYHFQRDYSYLNVKHYSSNNELKDLIVRSVNDVGEKWIVFIDDIDGGDKFKNELIAYGSKIEKSMVIETKDKDKIPKILAVNATSKSDKVYQEIVKNESLDENTYVLITTSVLDNGVNLRGISNIVTSDISKIKTLQMLGRARADGKEDRKTLYLKRFDVKYMNKRVDSLREQEDAYSKYDLAYGSSPDNSGYSEYDFLHKYYDGNQRDWKNASHWFGRPRKEPTRLYPNEIARSMLKVLIPTYEAILDEMQEEVREGERQGFALQAIPIGQKYLEYQLSWFGKKYDSENNLVMRDPKEDKKRLMEFLKRYAENEILISGNDAKSEFKKEFTLLHNRVFSIPDSFKKNMKRLSNGYGINTINELLNKQHIKYQVVTNDKTSIWKVEKIDTTK